MIGEKIFHDGEWLYHPETYDDGLTYGCIFKDEHAWENEPDTACYIPEHAFDDLEPIAIDGKDFYEVPGGCIYTRKIIHTMITDTRNEPYYIDDDEEDINEDFFFSELLWAFPETYLVDHYHSKD